MLMLELADELHRRGVSARIAVPAFESTRPYAEAAAERGIDVERTALLSDRGGRLRQVADAAWFNAGLAAPVVHYHLSENVLGHPFIRALDLINPAPMIFSIHSPYDEPSADTPETRRWANAVRGHAERVICVSKAGYARQVRYGVPRESLKLIYNGVRIDRFANGNGAAARRRAGIDADAPLIVYSARMEPQKRPLDALAAFADLAEEFPAAQLVFVGSGSLEEAARRQAAERGLGARVHVLGQQFDVPDWLAAATVWVLPTETEGFSIGVIEAMAAGCAIASTWCAGNDEVLVDGENALATPVGDVSALSSSLRRLMSDAALRARLGAAARATARRFSLERMVDEHMAVYAPLLVRDAHAD